MILPGVDLDCTINCMLVWFKHVRNNYDQKAQYHKEVQDGLPLMKVAEREKFLIELCRLRGVEAFSFLTPFSCGIF